MVRIYRNAAGLNALPLGHSEEKSEKACSWLGSSQTPSGHPPKVLGAGAPGGCCSAPKAPQRQGVTPERGASP